MASTLVLMRHGKAKAIEEGQTDFERELTEAGKRSLSATLVDQLVQMDGVPAPIEVWSSPATRAVQTALLLVAALKKRGVKVSNEVIMADSAWEQDGPKLLDDICDSPAETVIVVGHNPLIEDLTAELTGARIPFATGGIAAIRLNRAEAGESQESQLTGNETSNRLLWFAQGPISQHWRTLVQMEKTLRNASDTVESRLVAFFENPDDVETMHKFRVSIRTLRSLIVFVKPWQDPKQNAAMQEDLKEVVAATSRLRELDVLAAQAREATATSDGLVAFCEAEAAEERARVHEVLAGKSAQKRLKRVYEEAKDIRWKKRFCEEGLPASDVRKRFDAIAEKLELDLADLDLADVEPTHDVRKAAKRVRYTAENFKDLIGEDAVDIAKGMTAHQDNLGAVCDARVNIEIINGFQDREDIPEPVAWDLALLRAQNETFLYTTLRNAQERNA